MTEYEIPCDNTILVLDDDKTFRIRLGRALTNRGFEVILAASIAEAYTIVKSNPPAFAVLDIRLEDGNGLDVLDSIIKVRPDCKMVMLTGYGNIATAVKAIKHGAINYLAKPADADDICGVLLGESDASPDVPEYPISANRIRWEHIHRVLNLCNNNVTDTARRLNMHRRTLQRILYKRAPE